MIVTALLPRQHKRDDRPVLSSAPLKPGFDRGNLSRYSDPSWDLGPAVFRENARRCSNTVHFDSVENADIREALRELLYARLNIDLPGHRAKLPPASVRQVFNQARRFFEFVRAELGSVVLLRVDQNLLDRYARHLKADRKRRAAVTGQLLGVVSDLYLYRDHLSSGGLRFQPWKGRSPANVAGYRHVRENRTPRIPEPIITSLLAWSLRYVTVFAPDIFAARDEMDHLEGRRDAMVQEDLALDRESRRARQRERLVAFFDQRRSEGRGVPIWTTAHNGAVRRDPSSGDTTPPVNAHLLHLHIGIDAQTDPHMHIQLTTGAPDLIESAVAELGVETGGMDTPMSLNPDTGQPWRPHFDTKRRVSSTLRHPA